VTGQTFENDNEKTLPVLSLCCNYSSPQNYTYSKANDQLLRAENATVFPKEGTQSRFGRGDDDKISVTVFPKEGTQSRFGRGDDDKISVQKCNVA
jgi:hypothetical protein